MKSLNKILLAGGVIAILSLTQCDLASTMVSQLLFPAKSIDFPLGEDKATSYSINSWIEKPYVINFNIEYMNREKIWSKKIPEMPYRLSVKCYRLKKNTETLFFEDTYVIRDISYQVGNETHTVRENILDGGQSWEPNSNNPNTSGRSYRLKEFRLPYGRYRCDFKDESPPEIKAMLKESEIVRTAIEIHPFKLLFY